MRKTKPNEISLPFTVASMKTVLDLGANPAQSQYTHQDIAEWCFWFHTKMNEIDKDKAMEIANEIAKDIDAQWLMYLVNSHSTQEFLNLDFSKVSMPLDWFDEWLEQINKA